MIPRCGVSDSCVGVVWNVTVGIVGVGFVAEGVVDVDGDEAEESVRA